MINFYDLGPVTVFDGDVAQQKAPLIINVKGQSVSLAISDGLPLHIDN